MSKRRKLKYQLLVSRISTDGVSFGRTAPPPIRSGQTVVYQLTVWSRGRSTNGRIQCRFTWIFFYPLSFSDIENILKTSESKREKTEEIKIKKADIDLIVREIEVKLSNLSWSYILFLVYSEFGAESIVWIKGKSPGCSCLLFRLILIINRYLKCRYFYFR